MKSFLTSLFCLFLTVLSFGENNRISFSWFNPAEPLVTYADGTSLYYIETFSDGKNPRHYYGVDLNEADYSPFRFVIIRRPNENFYVYGVVKATRTAMTNEEKDLTKDYSPSSPILFGSKGSEKDMFLYGILGPNPKKNHSIAGTWTFTGSTANNQGPKLIFNSDGTGAFIEAESYDRIIIPQEPVYVKYDKSTRKTKMTLTGGYPIVTHHETTAFFSWRIEEFNLILNFSSIRNNSTTTIDFSAPMFSELSPEGGYRQNFIDQCKADFPTNHHVKKLRSNDGEKTHKTSKIDTLFFFPSSLSTLIELPSMEGKSKHIYSLRKTKSEPNFNSLKENDKVFCVFQQAILWYRGWEDWCIDYLAEELNSGVLSSSAIIANKAKGNISNIVFCSDFKKRKFEATNIHKVRSYYYNPYTSFEGRSKFIVVENYCDSLTGRFNTFTNLSSQNTPLLSAIFGTPSAIDQELETFKQLFIQYYNTIPPFGKTLDSDNIEIIVRGYEPLFGRGGYEIENLENYSAWEKKAKLLCEWEDACINEFDYKNRIADNLKRLKTAKRSSVITSYLSSHQKTPIFDLPRIKDGNIVYDNCLTAMQYYSQQLIVLDLSERYLAAKTTMEAFRKKYKNDKSRLNSAQRLYDNIIPIWGDDHGESLSYWLDAFEKYISSYSK